MTNTPVYREASAPDIKPAEGKVSLSARDQSPPHTPLMLENHCIKFHDCLEEVIGNDHMNRIDLFQTLGYPKIACTCIHMADVSLDSLKWPGSPVSHSFPDGRIGATHCKHPHFSGCEWNSFPPM